MTLALDLTRMIPSLPYKLDRIMDIGLYIIMATLKAIKENVVHASAPHAPYVSTLVQSTWHRALVLIFIFQNTALKKKYRSSPIFI